MKPADKQSSEKNKVAKSKPRNGHGTEAIISPFPRQTDLVQALKLCRSAARRGYEIAKDNLRESTKAIDVVSESLSQCLRSLESAAVRTPGIVDQLKSQLAGVIDGLEQLQRTSNATLIERQKHLDTFSVSLFGRTLAGKSTLMEILTQGDGRTIGTGAQRTTRDVRAYEWNGLRVTDVPGIAAFEGAEDEELAFKTAAQADLVLFLITDDAPQPAEAECLARVRRLGKPVLGILNVKVAVDEEDDLFLFLRAPEKPFDRTRIEQLLNQFHSFADQHTPGSRVPFVAAHIRSKFLAQRPEYESHKKRLLKASRFDGIESRIIKEVVERGTFLRIKSFVDDAVAPMMDLTDLLLKYSEQNSSSGRVLIEKKRRFNEWTQKFRTHGRERINTLISKLMDDLRDEVPTFAEEHYESSSAGKRWKRLVESAGIDRKVAKLQKELLNECKKALSEVARELKSELSLVASLAADRHIEMDRIFDAKSAWNWGINIAAGGLSIAALILGSGPFGWAAAAVGAAGWLISLLIDDREEKARRARSKLTKRLLSNIEKMEGDLRQKLGDWFHQELLGQQVSVLLNDLGAVTGGLFKLADAQRTLAWALNDRQKVLGRTLVVEALAQIGAEDLGSAIIDVARVPGMATMFVIEPTMTFPDRIRNGLERLLGEQIWFVINTGNRFSILAQAIGRDCERKKVSIEEKIRVAHVPLDDLGPIGKARVRLAQQLTGLHVMRRRGT